MAAGLWRTSSRERVPIGVVVFDSWWLIVLFVPLAVMGALAFGAFQLSNALVRPKRRRAPLSPDGVGIEVWEDVAFQTRDGLTLRGWFVPPSSAAHGASVICAHGTGSHRGCLLVQAAALHRAGFGALLFDLRGHGESDGALSSFGYHEMRDIDAAVEYLRSRSDVHPHRIAAMGHSMGGAATLRAFARRTDPLPLVIVAAISSLGENLRHGVKHFTRLPLGWLLPLVVRIAEERVQAQVSEIRPADDLTRLEGCPVLLVYGDDDRLVPLENGQRLYGQARGGDVSLLVIRGAGHRSVLNAAFFAQYEEALVKFLQRHLSAPKPTTVLELEARAH
jgi:alpha-beta hydrolase superfamily lysophospholipase